nr:hypothetical protein [Tanacetum cinerariifolium]
MSGILRVHRTTPLELVSIHKELSLVCKPYLDDQGQRTRSVVQHKPPPSMDHWEMPFSHPSDRLKNTCMQHMQQKSKQLPSLQLEQMILQNQYPLPEHTPLLQVMSYNAKYSSSTDDIAVQSYFFDIQLTSLSPRNCIPPEVL